MSDIILQTVVETPEFIKQAKKYMDEAAVTDFITYIAKNPLLGDLISGAAGARKIRWKSHLNEGKRGGVRIIYYYHDEDFPVFLFTVYAKNQKANLSSTEKLALRKIIKLIVKTHGENKDE